MAKVAKYELTLVFGTSPKSKAGEANLEKIKKTLADLGKITKEEDWGKKDLAYPIKKATTGYYYWFLLEADRKKIGRLDNILKLNDNIIRYLLVTID
jgi:small subunit ribosomal protein S6